MPLTPTSQAIVLLTASFGKSESTDERLKPLTKKEWGRFASWLRDCEMEPSDLLSNGLDERLAGWSDKKITPDRIKSLLDRGSAFAFASEKWERAGIWIVTRADDEYPRKLKEKLKGESPPILFGCGNKNRLNSDGIAVVGSRKACEKDLSFATLLGEKISSEGFSVVSGGACGIDENAMLGALKKEGTAVGVLGDNLLRSSTSKQYRDYIASNDLLLISPFNPEARFHVGNAMARNAYIYCLAEAAVVVSSTANKGGTWNGAIENLENKWVPLWVKQANGKGSGNSEIVDKGAEWIDDDFSVSDLLGNAIVRDQPTTQKKQMELSF